MKRRDLLLLVGALGIVPALPAWGSSALPPVEMFKSPYCGCCSVWAEHLEAAGFPVRVTVVRDTTATRGRLGMPMEYGSCHTATVGDYVIEGHVPAAEIRRLLAERPSALGLAVPGMPMSAPGMEVPGRDDPYEVLLVGRHGEHTVFARYPRS